MALLTITEAKAQCRVTHDLEDDLIQVYMDAADDYIKNYLNLEIYPQKPAIKAAALLIIEDLYTHRSAQTEIELYKNDAVEGLLHPFRQHLGI